MIRGRLLVMSNKQLGVYINFAVSILALVVSIVALVK